MTDGTHRSIVLGLTGGIAAFKSAELVRHLAAADIGVQVVMTDAATRFVSPVTLQALSGMPVFTDLWDDRVGNAMAHIDLSRSAALVVVAPATADFLAKLALGLADDLLSTLCLARECPLLVAPAMNRRMWEHPATQRNLERLRSDGVQIVGPDAGAQACGETGMGRMVEADVISRSVVAALAPKVLAGLRVMVTAGPTFERIDAVRGITNSSSGRMGYAVAEAAVEAGAIVTLVSGPTALPVPNGVSSLQRVVSAQDMFEAVDSRLSACDVFISVAAVADYTPRAPHARKLKKSDATLTLELVPTRDILAHVAGRPDAPFCVGFAAESENLEAFAEAKRRRKGIPLLAANLAQDAIGAESSELLLLDDDGQHRLVHAPKIIQARLLIAHLARLLGSQAQARAVHSNGVRNA